MLGSHWACHCIKYWILGFFPLISRLSPLAILGFPFWVPLWQRRELAFLGFGLHLLWKWNSRGEWKFNIYFMVMQYLKAWLIVFLNKTELPFSLSALHSGESPGLDKRIKTVTCSERASASPSWHRVCQQRAQLGPSQNTDLKNSSPKASPYTSSMYRTLYANTKSLTLSISYLPYRWVKATCMSVWITPHKYIWRSLHHAKSCSQGLGILYLYVSVFSWRTRSWFYHSGDWYERCCRFAKSIWSSSKQRTTLLLQPGWSCQIWLYRSVTYARDWKESF